MLKFTRIVMQKILNLAVLTCVLAGFALPARAQMAVPPPSATYQPLAGDQLDQLLGPIALYPDPLIAQILPAATLPTEIVLADRYVSGGGDPNQIDTQPWDGSIQALARYANVLKWMDDNLNWTTEVGQAFLNQQQDVMDSIQRLRTSANNLGNLPSTPQQQVVDDGGDIEILPADPQEVYVPVYQPDQVYYQNAGGSPFITFGVGFAVGGWLDHDFDWRNHNLIVWNHDHPRPANWWHERPEQRAPELRRQQAQVWHPENRPNHVVVNIGDRGWGNTPAQRPAPARQPSAPQRPAAPIEHQAPPPQHQPAGNGAFIGIQSSRDTSSYSNRGRQSLQLPTARPAQPAQPSRPPQSSHPAAPSGGGHAGGGNNNGGGSKHH